MIAKKNNDKSGPIDGFVRLTRTDAQGGYTDVPKEDVKRLLDVEKAIGVQIHVLEESNGTEPGGDN
jgi:hypothetical protein